MNPGVLWTVWSVPSIFLQGNWKWHMDTNGRCIACMAYQQWNRSLSTCTKNFKSCVILFCINFHVFPLFFFLQAAQRRCSCQHGERTSQSTLLSWRSHPCPCGSGSHHRSANQPLHPGQHLRCECSVVKKRDGFLKMHFRNVFELPHNPLCSHFLLDRKWQFCFRIWFPCFVSNYTFCISLLPPVSLVDVGGV